MSAGEPVIINILQCPFCGHEDVEIGEPEPGSVAVDCPECQCIGPFGDTMQSAIEKWNAAPRPTMKQEASNGG